MKLFKKLCLCGLCMALAGTLFAGCSSSDSEPSAQSDASVLNFGCYSYSDSLDPAVNVNSAWCGVRYGVTEALFTLDDNAVAQSNLCDAYEVSSDYLTWTFHITDEVFFSNGNPLTASAVKASLERLYAQTDASLGGTGNSNPDDYFTYTSLEADDKAGTLTITCSSPVLNMPGILSYPYFAIIDASVSDEIIGTGPYQVDSVNTGVSMELSDNEYYWNGVVPFETVNIFFIEDSSTKAMALQAGDIDLVENITTPSDLEKLIEDDRYNVSVAASVRTGNTYMNFEGVLANDALREAIVMAIDSTTLCDVVVGGMYTSGISVLPSSLAFGYDELVNPYEIDTEAAKEILDEAGIVDSDGDGIREIDGENIDLTYLAYSSRNLNDFAEAISLQLAEVGIGATVEIRDYDTALALQNAGEFDLITSNSITVGVGDPTDFLGNWYSGNSDSYGSYRNDAYDAAYEALLGETDEDARYALIVEMQQLLIDDAATIVHGYYNSSMISCAATVTGADIATMDYYWLDTDIAKVS